MNILINGFEAFGGNTLNASQELVPTLERIPMPGIRLETSVRDIRAALEKLSALERS